jgi:hypothetical protein
MRTYFGKDITFEELEWEPISEEDCLIPLKEFVENCNCGAFIDYDGYGVYALKDKKSNAIICPSDTYNDGKIETKHFTHVVWYNK